MCLLPQNQLLCQHAAIPAMQLVYISMHIPSLIMIERGLTGETCYISYRNPLYIDVYAFAAPKPVLVPARSCSCNAAMYLYQYIDQV